MTLWTDVESAFRDRTPTSEELYEAASDRLPAGVASTFRSWDPYPVFIDRATGVHMEDVDGNRYLDFALNNGAGMVGHAHPKVTEAIVNQAERGTMFNQPHELLIEAADELRRRWSAIDLVRFTNSGTESTMHAIRLARAYSGRDTVLKMEGAYHGAHDYALISKFPDVNEAGHPKYPRKIVESGGVPEAVPGTIEVAPYNDVDAVERLLEEHKYEIGALIVEPVALNIGVTEPRGDYLRKLRELCDEYGVVYIFDEVKTGAKIAPGGAADYYDVDPDLVTMAKSIGGNLPVGAFGGREEVMRTLEDEAAHFGTYNGNPLVLNVLVTVLREILTEDAYDHVARLNDALASGYADVIEDAGLRAHVDHLVSQGTVLFGEDVDDVRNYRDFATTTDESLHQNYWFEMLNRDVIALPHGIGQQWTISTQHEQRHVQRHLDAFKEVAPRLAREQESAD